MKQPYYFGVRHLSPAGAFHLRQFLDEKRPSLVLVEGPSDLEDLMTDITREETRPPVAILCYTRDTPVRSILYPFAEYSPEYQAILWCHENGAQCRFMDLPSDVFLAIGEQETDGDQEGEERVDVYHALDVQAGEDGHETFWERILEHTADAESYILGASLFGRNLRELTMEQKSDRAETVVREAYMSRRILDALREVAEPEKIVAVTGAYHVEGLKKAVEDGLLAAAGEAAGSSGSGAAGAAAGSSGNGAAGIVSESSGSGAAGIVSGNSGNGAVGAAAETKGNGTAEVQAESWCFGSAMTDEEIRQLPRKEASHTLMPYSYYRLSSRSGYGAGNKAPAYYSLLWEALCSHKPYLSAYSYLTRIAFWQRTHGTHVSSAEVIEAVRLALSLAVLRSGEEGAVPSLRDLRDAAVTCLGGGSLSGISLAVADTEIGTAIGALPDGVSRTSIQEDFYRQLKELKLERYRDLTAQDLPLDLRENRMVKSEKSAFLDLNRSFLLHRLRVIRVSFGKQKEVKQDNATWSEQWVLRWTPEAEIELVEAALQGDTIAQAASFQMKERVEAAGSMGDIALVIEDAFTCGMAAAVSYATRALQAMSVDAAALDDLAATAHRLSVVIQYGNIRRLDPSPLEPILQQLFYRSCLILPGACICDDGGSKAVATAMEMLNEAALSHEFLDRQAWISALEETAYRDDLNTRLSGFAGAILLERGIMDSERLKREVQRRLSRGIPADLGAGWFEGLAMKNRYALIARLSLWESLDEYLKTLDDGEFKRALVFLRRAFADFTSREKDEIAENLGEIWGLNASQVSETVNGPLEKEAQEMLESLDDFDFDF